MYLSQNTFDKASDTQFTFQFTGLENVISREESSNLLLNCNTVSIPGIATGTQQFNGQGAVLTRPYGNITFDTITVVFLVDEDLKNGKTLFNGVLYCNNNKDKGAFGEFKDNKVSGLLDYYNNFLNKTILAFKFDGMGCQGVSGINLSTKTDGSQYLEAQAQFYFDYVDFK